MSDSPWYFSTYPPYPMTFLDGIEKISFRFRIRSSGWLSSAKDRNSFTEAQSTVTWFRAVEAPEGYYIFGMRFDQEAPSLEELRLSSRKDPG